MQAFQALSVPQTENPTGGQLNHMEAKILEAKKEMSKIISFLKKRNTKENIDQLKDEFDQLLYKVTGKKKAVSISSLKSKEKS